MSESWNLEDFDAASIRLEARNCMSHTCRAKDAMRFFDASGGFLPELKRLAGALKESGD
jgi:hypothetical protein